MALSIIIIGAGASGLQAARRLSQAGHRVTLLEATAEPGGRILSLAPRGFSGLVEGGAEFVHGPLPFTLALAKEAGIALTPIRAQMTQKVQGIRSGEGGDPAKKSEARGEDQGSEEDWEGLMGDDWGLLMKKMEELVEDMPIAGFLTKYFGAQRYAGLRESVRRFAEGYDLADIHRVSTRFLYREWAREGEAEEYRPEGGYRRMIDWLVDECRRMGAGLSLSSPVVEVRWQKGKVEAKTAAGQVFTGDRLVVTASLGSLEAGGLRFDPLLPAIQEAVQRMGYGSVIKILLEFKTRFWLKRKVKDHTLFVLSDEEVPVWWTQTEAESRLLTGWLAGEGMRRFQQLDEEKRLESCLRSLAAFFSLDAGWLRRDLAASMILDWAEAPFVRGGYSFEPVGAADARAVLLRPVEGTLYFCGEALYEGIAPGTVEAAFSSGQEVAEKIIAQEDRAIIVT